MQQTTINVHIERWTKRVSQPFPRWQLKTTSPKSDPCVTPISLDITTSQKNAGITILHTERESGSRCQIPTLKASQNA